MTSLQQRALTGFSFAAVMAAGIFAHYYSFLILFALVTAMSLWEFFGLTLADEPAKTTRKIVYTACAMLPYLLSITVKNVLHLDGKDTFTSICILLVIKGLVAPTALFIFELFLKSEKPFQQLGYLFLSIFYISIPYSLLIWVAFPPSSITVFHPVIIFGMLLLVWSNDSFAYLFGSQIGKTKLFPRISPGKTWEGSGGGVLGSAIAAALLYLVFPNELELIDWVVLAVIASVFGTLGDLVESMLKRSLGVKDSGTLLPGHGGMLDRFDAFMFMIIPVFVYFTLR